MLGKIVEEREQGRAALPGVGRVGAQLRLDLADPLVIDARIPTGAVWSACVNGAISRWRNAWWVSRIDWAS